MEDEAIKVDVGKIEGEEVAKEVVIAPEEEVKHVKEENIGKEGWKPKTSLGIKVKNCEITTIDEVLDKRWRIMEQEIVDILLPNLQTDLLLIGQAKGKFGGGQRRVFKQTQKKTSEGNKPKFATSAVVGNENGYVGIGYSKSKETVPARERAIRNAKLNMIKIMPAPRGTGLCIERECQKILKLAGIKDVWSKTLGQTRTKLNMINACFEALKKLIEIKAQRGYKETTGVVEGRLETAAKE